MQWNLAIFSVLLLFGGEALADRPDSQTICDFYANQRYGGNNVTTQLRLMQGIVAYAYAGGDTLKDHKENSTGIFNNGKFNGYDVFLRSWFDGSKATTNFNDVATGINWLDGGGLDPLLAFLNGSTTTAKIRVGSNQEQLFSHWYVAFGKLYGCSLVNKFLETKYAVLTPAFVHKFMDLNQTQVGYFIDQLIVASKYYGFSDEDAQQLSGAMNTKYNNRCSAPDSSGQLNSICFAKDCPLAVLSADCNAYSSVGPHGFSTPTAAETTVLPTTPMSTNTGTNTPTAAAGGSSSSSLSAGAIAGIAIGGAVVILLAVGMWLFFRRQQNAKAADAAPAAAAQNQMSEGASTAFSPQSPYTNPHDSYYSRNPHDSYVVSTVGSPHSPPPAWDPSKTPETHELGVESRGPPAAYSDHQWGQMQQIAEMESPDPPPGWEQRPKP